MLAVTWHLHHRYSEGEMFIFEIFLVCVATSNAMRIATDGMKL